MFLTFKPNGNRMNKLAILIQCIGILTSSSALLAMMPETTQDQENLSPDKTHVLRRLRSPAEFAEFIEFLESSLRVSPDRMTDLSYYVGVSDIKFSQKFSIKVAIEIGRQIKLYHQIGDVYKHLSPAAVTCNEPLDENKEIKITLQENPQKPAVRFRSPESLIQGYEPAISNDVFMFGNILWQLLSWQRRPFILERLDTVIEWWLKNGKREEIPTDWGADYVQIIEKCWKPVDQRPDITEILEDLRNLLRKITTT